jgi:hypothetical protein
MIDFVWTDGFTGVILKRRHRWLAVIPGCPCCVPTEVLGSYSTRTQAAIALAEEAEPSIDGSAKALR